MCTTPWLSQVTDAPDAIDRDPDRERASPSRNPKTSQQASRFKRGLQLEKLKAGEKSGPSSAARRGNDRGNPRVTSLSRGDHRTSYDRDKSARDIVRPTRPHPGSRTPMHPINRTNSGAKTRMICARSHGRRGGRRGTSDAGRAWCHHMDVFEPATHHCKGGVLSWWVLRAETR